MIPAMEADPAVRMYKRFTWAVIALGALAVAFFFATQ